MKVHFNFSFYSSILLIFFSQGIIFSFLLIKKGVRFSGKADKWLSFFIFLCSIYLLPWMLGFAGWYSKQPYRDIMFYVPFQQVLLIGPTIYFYTRSLLNPAFSFIRKEWLHLLPAFAYMLYRLTIFFTDKVILNDYYFYSDGRDKNLDTWYQLSGFASMLIYFILSLRYYEVYKKIIFQTISFADNLLFRWIRRYLLVFLLMQILWLLFFFFYPGWGNFKEKWWYYFSFSSLMYYIGITGYSSTLKALIPFRISSFENNSVVLLETGNNEAGPMNEIELETSEHPEEDPATEEWKTKIMELMEVRKLYENPTLTLSDVARELNTNQSLISRAVNKGFNMNFNDFVNNYRVKAVIELFKKREHVKQTLLAISIDCGFNSKTTFNRCFKKYTGKSPKEYLEATSQTEGFEQ